MSFDSSATSAAWHSELADRDKALRTLSDSRSVEAENAALVQRLDALMAELRIARTAVAVRDSILREQSAALRDRDRELAATRSHAQTVWATFPKRLTRGTAKVLRAPRRLLRT